MPSTTLIGDAEVVRQLVNDAPLAGAPHCDGETLDAARINSGTPGLIEFVSGFMPAEVGAVSMAVDFSKGCYLGQEPVARLHWRGKANRNLRSARVEPNFPINHAPDAIPNDSDVVPSKPGEMPPMEWLEIGETGANKPRGWLLSWARAADGSTVGFVVARREVEDGTHLLLANTSTTVVVGPVVE
jgi:folate-binding protein YgfZ